MDDLTWRGVTFLEVNNGHQGSAAIFCCWLEVIKKVFFFMFFKQNHVE